jgi:hypothetical protein
MPAPTLRPYNINFEIVVIELSVLAQKFSDDFAISGCLVVRPLHDKFDDFEYMAIEYAIVLVAEA